jgi:hypothetical protein
MTQHDQEVLLATVPGDQENERVVVVLIESSDKPIAIRTETFSPAVGWFPQSELRVTRRELAGLKSVLGIQVSRACRQTAARVEEQLDDGPKVLSFGTARRA